MPRRPMIAIGLIINLCAFCVENDMYVRVRGNTISIYKNNIEYITEYSHIPRLSRGIIDIVESLRDNCKILNKRELNNVMRASLGRYRLIYD